MNKWFISLIILCFFRCNNFFSLEGIRGDDLLGDIQSHRSLYLISSFMADAFGNNNKFFLLDEETICSSDGIKTINPLTSPTGQSNFTVSNDPNSPIDLIVPAGVSYFRSAPLDNSTRVNILNIRSINGKPNEPCEYNSSLDICGTTDLSTYTFTFGNTNYSSGNCIALKCTKQALIRIRKEEESFNMNNNDQFLTILISPSAFKEILGVEGYKYYTRESVAQCKDSIIKGYSLYSAEVGDIATQNAKAGLCNLPKLNRSPNLAAYFSYQAVDCNIKEVNPLGF